MKSFLALGCLVLAGCAPSLSQNLQPQVGVMTVQQANGKFGPPIAQTKATDGSTTMVWAPKRYATAGASYVVPRGPTYGGSASGAHAKVPESRSQARLTLRFDRREVLQEWKYQHE